MYLFGIETEYGITREDLDAVDPVEESMELVRAHLTGNFERRSLGHADDFVVFVLCKRQNRQPRVLYKGYVPER